MATVEVHEQDKVHGNKAERTRNRPTLIPRVDIFETESAVVLLADLPGATEDEISVTLEKDVLTLEASVGKEAPHKHSLVHREFRSGDFYRAFSLTTSVERDKIAATLKHGVLRVELPKAGESRAQRIPLQAG